jgi:hypothetical protein
MAKRGLGMEAAFKFLVDASQRLNHKLRNLADVIIDQPTIIDQLGPDDSRR